MTKSVAFHWSMNILQSKKQNVTRTKMVFMHVSMLNVQIRNHSHVNREENVNVPKNMKDVNSCKLKI